MTVNSVTQSSINTDRMLSLRSQLDNLQRQLGTGMRADNYADLGSVRSTSLEFRAERAALDGYQEAIQRTEVTFAIMSETLERLDGIASEMKGDAIPTSFVIQNGDRTTAQVSAEFRFYETVTLLNTDVEGQFLFSGLAGDTKPVAPAADIMEGVGARDGFKQVLDERQRPILVGRCLILCSRGALIWRRLAPSLLSPRPGAMRSVFSLIRLLALQQRHHRSPRRVPPVHPRR